MEGLKAEANEENTKLYMYALGMIAAVLALRVLIKLIGGSGPSAEQLKPFRVAANGGALQQLTKDAHNRIVLKLAKKTKVSDDTFLFRFQWGNPNISLGLPVGAHVLFHLPGGDDGKDLMRKYTPVSDINMEGTVDFLIKIYRKTEEFPEGGKMSLHLESLKPGMPLLVSGPFPKITYQGYGSFKLEKDPENPIKRKNYGGIAGGTGITPIYNIIYHSLENNDGNTNSLIFANHSAKDILLESEIFNLSKDHPENFKAHHCVSKGGEVKSGDGHTHENGRITKECIAQRMPAPGPNTFITYCGPPMFERHVVTCLKELGYTQDMYMKH